MGTVYFISSYVTLLNPEVQWKTASCLFLCLEDLQSFSSQISWSDDSWPAHHLLASLAHSVYINSLENNYVLSHYKTELCKKPPRLCRQGYACPYYHNSKDRRRSPHKHKYRCSITSCKRKIFEGHVLFLPDRGCVHQSCCHVLAVAERCHVQLWSRVKNGGIPVNVREQRGVSIATQERNNSSTQRFVCFSW